MQIDSSTLSFAALDKTNRIVLLLKLFEFFLLLHERSGNANELPCEMPLSVTSGFASQRNEPNKVFTRDRVSLSAERSDCVAPSPLRPAGATPSRAELKMKYFLNKD